MASHEQTQVSYAFLGPKGTFSQAALFEFMPQSAGDGNQSDQSPNDYQTAIEIECPTIPEVFELVRSGRATYGAVPIENSLEGSVNATLDEFAFGSTIPILAEATLDIHHAFIAAPGTTLDEVKTVVSHPQALGQCTRWIARNLPGRETIAANSTAEAVRLAVENPTYGAIAPRLAADLYGGEVLFDAIEDFAGNQTRFVLFGRGDSKPTGHDKTSLALFLKADKPGALLMILAEFAYGGINLTKIQSRPTKQAMGEYMFFIDIEGHMEDPDVRTALDSLRLKLREVKVLGSYPRGE